MSLVEFQEQEIAMAAANPYVGPRAFRRDELYFGRERESTGLTNTLLAGRVGLLHSPSGAGKTSLIQASIVPAMESRGFQVCPDPKPSFAAVRVNTPLPPYDGVSNRYVFSAVLSLAGHLVSDPRDLSSWTIRQALDILASQPMAPERQFLVVDQFEEILTLDPTDHDGRLVFFKQMGEALDTTSRWALFAMREDFMGGLDRYLRYIPGQFRSTFRLDLLESEAATQAICNPARAQGIDFDEQASAALVNDLRRVRVESPEDGIADRLGSYVEPVLLQVTCDSLWRQVAERQGQDFHEVSLKDVVSFGPLDNALSGYYRLVVNKAALRAGADERVIRDWVQENLLTRQSFRSQTRTPPAVEQADAVISYLQSRYLIREDPRLGATWWELSHDRLIEPIIDDNRIWREEHLFWWQRDAYQWQRSQRQSRYLLTGQRYRLAKAQSRGVELSPVEQSFLESSAELAEHEGRLKRVRSWLGVMQGLLICSLALNLILVYLLRR